MGHTQFMPTTYQKHAVDFDGDGKRDLWGASDALASTANYLSSLGWRKGQRWGFEVELPPGFDYLLADETTERPLSMWVELGLRVIGDHAAATEQAAVLVLPAGAHGPAFLLLPISGLSSGTTQRCRMPCPSRTCRIGSGGHRPSPMIGRDRNGC